MSRRQKETLQGLIKRTVWGGKRKEKKVKNMTAQQEERQEMSQRDETTI